VIGPRVPAAVIAQQLAARAEALVYELFPDAKPEGAELRWHGRGGAACSMALRGAKRGLWCDWTDGDRQAGDALELVHHALFPDENGRRESIAWAARWLGLERATDADLLRLRRLRFEVMRRAERRDAEGLEKRRRTAVARYLAAREPPPLAAAIVSYLAGRGVPVDELSEPLHSLRFDPAVPYDAVRFLPAMLAPIIPLPQGKLMGVHMTFLAENNGWHKAPVVPAKKINGSYDGGVIPLLRGRSGLPMRDAPQGDAVLIGEGIENALAASLLLDEAPRVVACCAVNNLAKLMLPPAITTVYLAYDRDGENENVRRIRERACARFKREKRSVETLKPPAGIKDFADYVLADWDGVLTR
jgi:hypothetical protein